MRFAILNFNNNIETDAAFWKALRHTSLKYVAIFASYTTCTSLYFIPLFVMQMNLNFTMENLSIYTMRCLRVRCVAFTHIKSSDCAGRDYILALFMRTFRKFIYIIYDV